ncbi:MAG: KH domain-containing protein [Candidatus Bipolaricaulota bacterium]
MLHRLLAHLLKPLVDHPDRIEIDHIDTEDVDIFLVSVPESDRGHVLGRDGQTAEILREIMGSAAKSQDRDVVIDILD